MTEPRYRGGCLCGSIRYEATGAITDLCTCHCESCRRATGGIAVPWGTFQSACFAITLGELAEHRSSPDVVRGFCASCGTSLTYRHAKRAHEVDVALVTLDDPSAVAPKDHIWVQDRLAWDVIGDGLPQFLTVRTANAPKG